MKQIFTLLAAVLLTATTYAQVGIGTTDPNGSAALDITSTTKGLLIPRMTAAERDLISPAATGLMIYQTDGATGFYYYNGSSWANVGYTDELVSANTDVAANTAKVDVLEEELVSANTDVAANTAKVGYTEAAVSANTDVAANTAKVGYTEAAVSANTDVAVNTAKVGYTDELVSANTDVAANTAKVGITTDQSDAIVANTLKVSYTQPIYSVNTLYHELGGYVIEINADGTHGLVLAMQDQGTSNWYQANDLLSNAANHDVNGAKFKDWRIPTKRELNLMYGVYIGSNGANLNANSYWSSTENVNNTAWEQFFSGGSQYSTTKVTTDFVRAVRAF